MVHTAYTVQCTTYIHTVGLFAYMYDDCTVVHCTHYLHVIGCRTFYLMYRSDHSSHHCNWIYGDYLKYIFVLLIFIHFLYFRGSLCSIGVWTSPRLSPSSKLNLLWSWGLWSYPKNCTMTFVAYNSAENFVRLHEREVQGMPARHCSRRSCWLIVNWISLGKLETTQKLTSHIVPASPNSRFAALICFETRLWGYRLFFKSSVMRVLGLHHHATCNHVRRDFEAANCFWHALFLEGSSIWLLVYVVHTDCTH